MYRYPGIAFLFLLFAACSDKQAVELKGLTEAEPQPSVQDWSLPDGALGFDLPEGWQVGTVNTVQSGAFSAHVIEVMLGRQAKGAVPARCEIQLGDLRALAQLPPDDRADILAGVEHQFMSVEDFRAAMVEGAGAESGRHADIAVTVRDFQVVLATKSYLSAAWLYEGRALDGPQTARVYSYGERQFEPPFYIQRSCYYLSRQESEDYVATDLTRLRLATPLSAR